MFLPRMGHGKHRTLRLPDNRFGHTAQQDATDRAPAMRTHHNQVRGNFLCGFYDLNSRSAFAHKFLSR